MKNLKKLLPLNHFVFALFLLILAGACREKVAKNPEQNKASLTITFGLQPSDNAKNLDLFVNEMSKKLGHQVEVKVAKDYSELVSMMKTGNVDFAFFSPLNLIDAEKSSGLKVLLKKVYNESEFYYSAIVVRRDSPIKNLGGLRGKKMAFVDPKSTSGYLYPQVLLKSGGLALKDVTPVFSGTHKASIELLEKKEVDAVAVWADEPEKGSGAWTEEPMTATGKKFFRALVYSDPIPNDAFVVRNEFYTQEPSLTLQVMEKMIELGEGDNSILKSVFGIARLATATSRHYDSVRQMNDVISQK